MREMMFGTRERFDYFLCEACSTLQIAQIPDDLGRYYSSETYYSFNNADREPALKRILKRFAARGMVGRPAKSPRGNGPMDRIRRGAEPWTANIEGLKFDSAILDVGCGEGARLEALARLGFSNLTGVDPFLPAGKAGTSASGVTLKQGALSDVEGRYDCITMHHSLEHFADPGAMLESARNLLSPGGAVFVRIPIFQSEIWDRYGADWAQIDAPRHLFLFSPDAFVDLTGRHGFECTARGYDTLGWSLAWSEAYSRDIPMYGEGGKNPLPFDDLRLKRFEDQAKNLNAEGKGDQGYFVLRAA